MSFNMSDSGIQSCVQEQMAIEMAAENSARSLTAAADMVGTAPSTIMHHRRGRKSREEASSDRQKLTPEEEKIVVDRCYFRYRLGFPATIWQLCDIALSILRKRKPEEKIGKRWEVGFRRRHPEMKFRFSKQLDFVRKLRGNDIGLINHFFDELESIVQDYEIKPPNTYNIDEIGFLLGLGKSERVLEIIRNPRENRELKFRAQSGNREFVTVIERICGDDSNLDPTIILKAKDFIAEWFKRVEGVPENLLFGKSHNGWTDEIMAMKYLERNFGPTSTSALKAGGEYRLLLFDGHSSHVNPRFLDYCVENKIIPYCLPPHTTHHLQPLDVSIFGPYKHYYQKQLTYQFENHEYGVSKANFYEILMAARHDSFTASNIYSGFWYTGLIPVDRSVILRKIEHSTAQATALTSTQNPTEHSIQYSQESSPSRLPVENDLPSQPITAFTVQEIDAFQIPSTKSEIKQHESIVHATLPTNDPIPWGLKKIVGNLATCGNRDLTDLEEKKHQIESLQQQLADRKAKKPVNRSRIPVQGKAWINCDDIKTFFASQTTEAHRTAKRKYEAAQQLASTRKVKLVNHTQKREEVQKLEEEGKLPKGRKTGAMLLKEEHHLVELISKADGRVEKLEHHIDELAKNIKSEEREQTVKDTESDEYFDGTGVDATPAPMVVDESVE